MQISLVIHVELIGVFLESVSQFQLNNSSEMVSHANSADRKADFQCIYFLLNHSLVW